MCLTNKVASGCFALVCYFVSLSLCAQNELFTQYKFHRLDESVGLINNVVNDIIQDSLGQIWVGTNEGLFRYQGVEFQQFIKGKGYASELHNNFIEQLYLDKMNDLWLMTDDGVGRYSYHTDKIERFLPEVIQGRISSMAVDDHDNIYFGKYESGIMRVSGGVADMLDLYDEDSQMNFNEASVLKVAVFGDYLWALISDIGAIRYDISSGKIVFFGAINISHTNKLQLFDLVVGDTGEAWITTEKGIFILSVVDGMRRTQKIELSALPDDDYMVLFRESNNRFSVGTRQNGMYKIAFDGDQYRVTEHITRMLNEYGISSGTVSEIYQERNGNFWIGTHNGGINVFSPKGEMVRSISYERYDSRYSLEYENVWGITTTDDDKILVGTDGTGISLLDPKTGAIINNAVPEVANEAILCLHEDVKKRLWIGTYSGGVYIYDKTKNTTAHFTAGGDHSDLWVNDIRCFYESPSGEMFIGTNQGGLYRYDDQHNYIREIAEIRIHDIRDIVGTDAENIWLGTFGKGVLKFNTVTQELVRTAWSRSKEHAKEVVTDMYFDGNVIWVATRHNAVVAFDPFNEVFISPKALSSLSGRSVSAVCADQAGRMWLTMNTGVCVFDPRRDDLRQFDDKDGFQKGHFNFGSILCAPDGFMAMGGINGLNLFYPEELLEENKKSTILLNQFKIFDKTMNPVNSDIFPDGKSIFLADEITLDHSDNIFSISFSFPGYVNYSPDDFLYMLEGYESNWQYGAESDVATYRNVPPGNYTFRVKSKLSENERLLKITIRPPFWKTWPAYLLYLLLIGFVIYRYNRFSNSRVVLKQKLAFETELREKEKASMQEKLRFYTNFSHELKTPLTLIQGPVNDLLNSTEDVQQRKYLQLIKKNTGVILRFISRMLEFRKIEMNKSILHVAKHDLKFLAQEEAESFAYLAKERGVKFGFYCESELEAWIDLEKIQIVMNNLLSNAFKFTPAGKSVNFGILERENEILIEVKDEGVGIKASEIEHIFSPFYQASNSYSNGGTGIGLALSKSFVELHMGTIEVQSEEGKGTAFLVRIPKGREKFETTNYVRFVDAEKKESELLQNEIDDAEERESLEAKENEKLMLVVDDNKDISAYIESMFEGEYQVVKAENGVDALEVAISQTPDIIISDLMMPKMDGLEFCKRIKSNIATSHVPVIMLTAKDSKADQIKGYEVGVDGYITKPFSSGVLMARVNNLLMNRQMLEIKYESSDLVDPQSSQSAREAEFVLNAEKITLEMLERSEFSVPQLCKELGMSQSALYRKIKSLTGVSIQVFIRKIRIKRAAHLLLTEDMTVTEIAFSLEFADLKYFRKCFKDQFGKNPSEYKAAFKEQTENV